MCWCAVAESYDDWVTVTRDVVRFTTSPEGSIEYAAKDTKELRALGFRLVQWCNARDQETYAATYQMRAEDFAMLEWLPLFAHEVLDEHLGSLHRLTAAGYVVYDMLGGSLYEVTEAGQKTLDDRE